MHLTSTISLTASLQQCRNWKILLYDCLMYFWSFFHVVGPRSHAQRFYTKLIKCCFVLHGATSVVCAPAALRSWSTVCLLPNVFEMTYFYVGQVSIFSAPAIRRKTFEVHDGHIIITSWPFVLPRLPVVLQHRFLCPNLYIIITVSPPVLNNRFWKVHVVTPEFLNDGTTSGSKRVDLDGQYKIWFNL